MSQAAIGPNAVLQLLPLVHKQLGSSAAKLLLREAGLDQPPDPAAGLMPEQPAARMHQALRLGWPLLARDISAAAGANTAEYLLAHRIPRPVQRLLRFLPPSLSAGLLTRAIAANAWTFCGSGQFAQQGWARPVLLIRNNPLVRGESAEQPLCSWHRAVFVTLYNELCGGAWEVIETQCCAQGAPSCRFELRRLPPT